MIKTFRHLFTPHRSNNHRPRLLHPLGVVIMVAVLVTSSSAVDLIQQKPPQGLVLGYASNITQHDVFVGTNQERTKAGLEPLILSERLNTAAYAKAQDMFAQNYWAHVSPAGVPPWQFIRDAGYRYSVAGENLARDFDTTGPMVSAWMASPTHKDNILHARYLETGIAVVNGNLDGLETTLVVQMFGAPIQGVLTAEPEAPPAQISQEALSQQVSDLPVPTSSQAEIIAEPELVQLQPTVLSQTEGEETGSLVYVSPLDIKKSIVLAVILLIMAVLVIDEVIIRHNKTVRFVGRNVAHMSFLVLVLLIVLNIIQPGSIQ